MGIHEDVLRLFVRRGLVEFADCFFVGVRSVDDVIERGELERRCSGREAQAFEDLARNCRIFDDCNESEGGSAAWTAKPIAVNLRFTSAWPAQVRSRKLAVCTHRGGE